MVTGMGSDTSSFWVPARLFLTVILSRASNEMSANSVRVVSPMAHW
jgi:hypothetical protein